MIKIIANVCGEAEKLDDFLKDYDGTLVFLDSAEDLIHGVINDRMRVERVLSRWHEGDDIMELDNRKNPLYVPMNINEAIRIKDNSSNPVHIATEREKLEKTIEQNRFRNPFVGFYALPVPEQPQEPKPSQADCCTKGGILFRNRSDKEYKWLKPAYNFPIFLWKDGSCRGVDEINLIHPGRFKNGEYVEYNPDEFKVTFRRIE